MEAKTADMREIDERNDIDEVFEELRGKLIQLDRKNAQSEKQSEEIERLLAEKKEAFLETEKLKFINQDLQGQISILKNTASLVESLKNELQEKHGSLKVENERLLVENDKLTTANRKLQIELSELQKNHSDALEKMTVWQNIQQEVSSRQQQCNMKMLSIAKKIGHSKATSLYLHQLKSQVDSVYKNAYETIKHLQDSRDNMDNDGHDNRTQNKRSFPEDSMDSDTLGTSSKWRQTETYWKSVNDSLRSEMQTYKEELWSGLQTLRQLSVNPTADETPVRQGSSLEGAKIPLHPKTNQ